MSKVKTVSMKKKLVDNNMSDMFKDIFTDKCDINKVQEKYVKITDIFKKLISKLQIFIDGPFFKNHENYGKLWKDDFVSFKKTVNKLLSKVFEAKKHIKEYESIDLSSYTDVLIISKDEQNYDKKYAENIQKFANDKEFAEENIRKEYSEIKNLDEVKKIIILSKDCLFYKEKWMDPNKLDDKWILEQPGLSFKPFNYISDLDLKLLWLDENIDEKDRKYIYLTFSILLKLSHQLWTIITSPDVDMKKYTEIIEKSINEIRNIPELNRCSRAFKKIKNSMHLLEDKFPEYYKDSISSKDPTAMIGNFIVDVSNNEKMDASLLLEFKKIINFYKKQKELSKHQNDPKLDKIFESLQSKINIYDSYKNKVDKTTGQLK